MPIPKPVLYPPFNTLRISHVEYGVSDLNASRKFYSETLGLQITDEDSNTVYLRAMEERGHHCVILRKSKAVDVKVLGFKVFSENDLDKAELYFKKMGQETNWVNRPYQGRTLLTSDNNGIPLEFYFEMDRLETIHQKYNLYRGVKPLRIDHFNCFSPNVGTSILRCDTIFVLILSVFFVDLSIMEAKPKSLPFAFLINLTHSKLDFPVVITSSIIRTLAPFLILKPLLSVNFPLTLSQKIVSFLRSLPIS